MVNMKYNPKKLNEMRKEETTIDQMQNEDTTLDQTATQGTISGTTATGAATPQKKKGEWKKVAVGAGVGLVFGTATAAFFSSAASGGNVTDNHPSGSTPSSVEPVVDDKINMATCVDDDMSFSQAFAAARAEVGPGGAFEWHGNLYNTYTAEEWDGMTAEERADYNEHFSWAATSADEPLMAQTETSAEEEAEVMGAGTPQEQEVSATAQESEVNVLGVEHDAETGANLAYVTVDGQDAVLVDVDGGGQFDVLAADLNGDGQLTDNEIVDIADANITVDGLGGYTTDPANDVYYASNEGGEIDYAGGDGPLGA